MAPVIMGRQTPCLRDAPKRREVDVLEILRDEASGYAPKGLAYVRAGLLTDAADEIEQLRALLRRGLRQIGAWQEFYGRHCNGPTMGNVLPPAGDIRWAEDVSEALKTPNELK
jgi:hypothetical protein